MAINRLRLRDTMVNRGIAAEAPAMEFADVLDDELDSALSKFATKQDLQQALDHQTESIKRYVAEQTNKIVAVTLGGFAVGAAIVGIIVTVT